MTSFEFKWSWRLCLAPPVNRFNFVTQKFEKRTEKCRFKKLFSKRLAMTKFWFKQLWMSCFTLPENSFNFVTQKLQETENFFFLNTQNIRFWSQVASKPFSKKLPMINFEFRWFWRLGLAFPENDFNFVTQKFELNWKMPFSNTQNIRFWAQGSLKTIF